MYEIEEACRAVPNFKLILELNGLGKLQPFYFSKSDILKFFKGPSSGSETEGRPLK